MSLSIPSTFVYWWCTKLCECFHCSAGCAVSHSQLEEWISGSFIQSHWPCMTLWPISMFSRILCTPSNAVPATQAGLRVSLNWEPIRRVSRPATARPRWILISRLMYAASESPRDSSMSLRIASSSRPSCSTSSSLRWVYSLTSEMAMFPPFGGLSDVERAVADGGGDAGLHGLVGLPELVAAAQVADRAVDEGQRAGVADAHPAAVRHADAGLLARLQDGGGAVGVDRLPAVLEGDRAAFAALTAELEREPLEVQLVLETGLLEVLGDGVEHRARPAGPGLPLLPVGAQVVELGELEHALVVGVPAVQRQAAVPVVEL